MKIPIVRTGGTEMRGAATTQSHEVHRLDVLRHG